MKKVFTAIIPFMMVTLYAPTITSINPNSVVNKVAQPITSIGGANFTENENGLIGGWHMDEASGLSVADFSGNNNTGTATATGTNIVPGKFGNARSFDGSGYITLPNSYASTFNSNDFSIVQWVYYNGSANNMVTFSDGTSAVWYSQVHTYFGGGKMQFDFWNAGMVQNTSPTTGWHFYVCTYVHSTKLQTIYYDGNADGTNTAASNPTVSPGNTYLGHQPNYSNNFTGDQDEVRIYNRVLSADEIKNLYLYNSITAPSPSNAIFFGTEF